jgi:long-chain-fatty-acid--CoA ligase ACSBG
MVIGDRKKFLSCLLTLRVETDPDSLEPKSELTSACKEWCRGVGCKAETAEEAAADDAVRKAIQDGMERVNRQATSNAQKVQKWHLVAPDFSVPGGELGPTLKLKRHYVLKKYDATIKNFYRD